MNTPPGSAASLTAGRATALVVAVAVLAFLPSLRGGFLADDFVYIAHFRELPWSEWPRLFVQEWSSGIWGSPLRELRPFAALSFMGDARLFGGDPLGYRLVNLTLHVLVVFLVFRLTLRYSGNDLVAATIGGLAFALHPAHAETVSWITGRVDLQATVAALLFWLAGENFAERSGRRQLFVATAALFVGVFSKELCVFAPLLLALRWGLVEPRVARGAWLRRALVLAGAVLVIAAYSICRRIAFPHESVGYNLWTDVPAWERQATYFGWLVPILPLLDAKQWSVVPSTTVLHALWLVLATTILVAFAAARWRGHRRATEIMFFGGVWFLVTVAPLTAVHYASPRHLYFPTVGLALALGIAFAARRALRWAALVIGVVFALGHVMALRPWMRAGAISRETVARIDTALQAAPAGHVVAVAVPAVHGPAWLWAWCMPHALRPPFLYTAPAHAIELPVNVARSEDWLETRRPLERLRAAQTVTALHVDDAGSVASRTLSREDLRPHLEPPSSQQLTPDGWDGWVRSVARP